MASEETPLLLVFSMMAPVKNTWAQVIRATERALQGDQQASLMLGGGGNAKCSSPVGKSYSKSTINGRSSVSVGLRMPVRGSGNQVNRKDGMRSPCIVAMHAIRAVELTHWS